MAHHERPLKDWETTALVESIRAYIEAATPHDELSGNTGELIDKMADAIRGDTILDDTPWETLSEDRKIGWRGDAERALAVVKEHLTSQAATALRLSAGGGWRDITSAPECDWTKDEKPTEALLYSRRFGVRTGKVGRFRDHLFGSVANLHGNAVADLGATHWMPLPRPPASPTVEAGHVE